MGIVAMNSFVQNEAMLDNNCLFCLVKIISVLCSIPVYVIFAQTTLVKLLVGALKPTIGEVKITPGCRVAVVNQHHADQIDLDLTPLAFMKRQFPGDGSYNQDQKLRSHLASCGVGSDKMLVRWNEDKKSKTFSEYF